MFCAETQGGHVPRAEGGAHGPGEGQDPPRDISRGETRAAPVQVQGLGGGADVLFVDRHNPSAHTAATLSL